MRLILYLSPCSVWCKCLSFLMRRTEASDSLFDKLCEIAAEKANRRASFWPLMTRCVCVCACACVRVHVYIYIYISMCLYMCMCVCYLFVTSAHRLHGRTHSIACKHAHRH
jgi:Ca2+/Na+ antiporter